jgi:F0F1-type ATP synthase membrane subunit c/vacuolar-type H+-ATPase subunit K
LCRWCCASRSPANGWLGWGFGLIGNALVVLARTSRSVPQLNLTGRYITSALVYFGLVVALGIIFVANKRLAFWPVAVLPSIAGHALLGGVG